MRQLRLASLVTFHGAVLMTCSLVGIVGYYGQHGRFQITAGIPAMAGLILILGARCNLWSERTRAWLLFFLTFAFGMIVTRLAIRFIPQAFQPLRKRVYFPVMALSSIVTSLLLLWRLQRFTSKGRIAPPSTERQNDTW